jgi:hypothetical protein
MTMTFRAHFDGKVIVPDGPVDLPVNVPLIHHIELASPSSERSQEPRKANNSNTAQKQPPRKFDCSPEADNG